MTEQLATRAGTRQVLESLVGIPFTEGNRVDVLKNGEETFPAMLGAIAAARRSIDLLWFAWRGGEISHEIAAALAARARDGVRVRIMLDGYGAQHIDRDDLRLLRDSGCTVFFYRPVPSPRITVWNLRTHRRVMVCDETVGLTGGTVIDQAWTGGGLQPERWRDTAFRVRGPAVAGLRSAFVSAWMQAQVRLQEGLISEVDRFPELRREGPSAVQVLRTPSQPGWSEAAVAIAAMLETARESVRVTTPISGCRAGCAGWSRTPLNAGCTCSCWSAARTSNGPRCTCRASWTSSRSWTPAWTSGAISLRRCTPRCSPSTVPSPWWVRRTSTPGPWR